MPVGGEVIALPALFESTHQKFKPLSGVLNWTEADH